MVKITDMSTELKTLKAKIEDVKKEVSKKADFDAIKLQTLKST